MVRSALRLLAVTVVLAHVAVACDGGDLNPQPLPPVDNSGRGTGSPSTGGQSGDNAADPTVSGDAGAAPNDAGDGGDASDGGDGNDGGDGGKR